MDIPKPPTSLLVGQHKTELPISPGAKLAKLLGLPLTQKVEANITSVSSISASEREELTSFHLNNSRLPSKAQQKLLKLLTSPELKLLGIELRGKPLHTLTDLKLSVGQKVLVKITPQGQLLASLPSTGTKPEHVSDKLSLNENLRSSTPTSKTTHSTATTSSSQNLDATTKLNPQLAANHSVIQNASNKSSNPGIKTMPEIKNYVNPQNTAAKDSLKSEQALLNNQGPQSRTAHTGNTHAQLPNSTALNAQLQTQESDSAQKSQEQTRSVIHKLSGEQLKLVSEATAARINSAASSSSQFIQGVLKITPMIAPLVANSKLTESTLPDKSILAIKNLLSTPIRVESPRQLPIKIAEGIQNSGLFYENKILKLASNEESAERLESDIKWQLQNIAALATTPDSKLPQNQSFDKLLQTLFTLLANTKAAKPQDVKSKQTAIIEFKSLLSTLANKALEKIQLNQYQSAVKSQSDSSVLYTEIPIRYGDWVLPLKIDIRERRDKEEEKDAKKHKRKKAARWSVFLEMDLKDDDTLAAQVDVNPESIDLKLWANNPSLRKKALRDIDELKMELQDNGLNVGQIQCSEANPPMRETRFDWNLIDIQT